LELIEPYAFEGGKVVHNACSLLEVEVVLEVRGHGIDRGGDVYIEVVRVVVVLKGEEGVGVGGGGDGEAVAGVHEVVGDRAVDAGVGGDAGLAVGGGLVVGGDWAGQGRGGGFGDCEDVGGWGGLLEVYDEDVEGCAQGGVGGPRVLGVADDEGLVVEEGGGFGVEVEPVLAVGGGRSGGGLEEGEDWDVWWGEDEVDV
jgi:hypothetical protein